jgi:hypothetical protein
VLGTISDCPTLFSAVPTLIPASPRYFWLVRLNFGLVGAKLGFPRAIFERRALSPADPH